MDSMFDRLGDLLSATLDDGELPKNDFNQLNPQIELEEYRISSAQKNESEAKSENNAEKARIQKKSAIKKNIAEEKKSKEFFVPYHLKTQFSLLGITGAKTTEDEIKVAYKEQLRQFHPDKQKNIPILQKIATTKTSQIIEAYKDIQNWLVSHAAL